MPLASYPPALQPVAIPVCTVVPMHMLLVVITLQSAILGTVTVGYTQMCLLLQHKSGAM